MFSRISLAASVLVALLCSVSVVAAPQNLEERSSNVCASGIYGELTPLLKGYAPAAQYCSAHYTLSCTTARKRSYIARQASTTRPISTTAVTTTTTKDARASALSSLEALGAGIVSTLCSCINGPATACSTSTTPLTSKPISTTPVTTKPISTTPPTTTPTTTTPTTTTPITTTPTTTLSIIQSTLKLFFAE